MITFIENSCRAIALCATYGPYTAASKLENVSQFTKDNCARAADQYLETLAKAHEHNVIIVFGGDTHHAHPRTEYKALIQAGFSPMEALNAGTANVATFLGYKDRLGTIEKGKLVDLVFLRGNPLENPDPLKESNGYTPEGLEDSRLWMKYIELIEGSGSSMNTQTSLNSNSKDENILWMLY